jgi:hypothetical protein
VTKRERDRNEDRKKVTKTDFQERKGIGEGRKAVILKVRECRKLWMKAQ